MLAFFLVDWQEDADRKEETLAIISDLLGFSWTGKLSNYAINFKFYILNFKYVMYFRKRLYFR